MVSVTIVWWELWALQILLTSKAHHLLVCTWFWLWSLCLTSFLLVYVWFCLELWRLMSTFTFIFRGLLSSECVTDRCLSHSCNLTEKRKKIPFEACWVEQKQNQETQVDFSSMYWLIFMQPWDGWKRGLSFIRIPHVRQSSSKQASIIQCQNRSVTYHKRQSAPLHSD